MINVIETGEKKDDVAGKRGVAKRTIATIWRNRERIRQQTHKGLSSRMLIKETCYEDVDSAVFKSLCDVLTKNIHVRGPILQAKARSFAFFAWERWF